MIKPITLFPGNNEWLGYMYITRYIHGQRRNNGANVVITEEVPANTAVEGIPAKIIKAF